MLSTFTQNKQDKLRKQIAYLGKPEEKRIYRADERGQLLKFFCALGLPYTPVEIAQLTAAYHAVNSQVDSIPFFDYVKQCFPSLTVTACIDVASNAIDRYNQITRNQIVAAPIPMPAPVVEAPKAETPRTVVTDDKVAQATKLLAELLGGSKAELDEDKVVALIRKHSVATEVKISDKAGTVVIPTGLHHNILPDVLMTLKAGINVYLVGPAGSGKTTLAIQLAKALGVKFHFNGALDSEYKLTGFMDANGKYVRTAFREAYEHGGLYLFDELDASAASALLAFNAALENGHSDFPDGCIPMHKDFYCIAAANTYGTGADRVYIGRNQLDGAFLDRFAFIEMNYDEKLERAVAGNDQWVDFVQGIRRAIKQHKIRHIVSPRASIKGAQLLAHGMRQDKVEQLLIWKGLDDDSISKIRKAA